MTASSHPKSPRPRKERRISVRGVRREPPDLELLAKAIARMVIKEAEDETARLMNERDKLKARGR